MRITGSCQLLLAFDIGFSVDLGRAASRLAEGRSEAGLRNARRAPTGETERTVHLRFVQPAEPIPLPGAATAPTVEITVFDFGGAGVNYTIPIDGPLEALVDLSDALLACEPLLSDARGRMGALLDALGDAVKRPGLAPLYEDYPVFSLRTTDDLVASEGPALARILRGESGVLSGEETVEALSRRCSYRPGEIALVDWHAAILIGDETTDERLVLEHANHELLQLRLLDHLLDRAVAAAHEELERRRPSLGGFTLRSDAILRLARMQADYAILFEGVHNPLKLTGDQYLARLYRVVSERFRLREWDEGIDRKLRIIESIREKTHALTTTRRLELLEWIIIVLIALSIGVYFLP